MCVGVSVFGVSLHSAISTLATFVLATDSTRSQFNDCCFVVVYQVTVRYKTENGLYPNQCTNGHV